MVVLCVYLVLSHLMDLSIGVVTALLQDGPMVV